LRLVDDGISRAQTILVLTHVAPDGDAIGSLLGLGWMLHSRGKRVTMGCEDLVPESSAWLPGSSQIVQQASGPYDLVVSVDCSDQRRMGRIYTEALALTPLINIDHHITNTQFGTVNWVDPACAATAQMVLDLVDRLGWELTAPAATCLLNGLVTDTRSFRTQNVDAAVLRAALRLMEAGASLSEVAWQSLEQRPLAAVRLWGQAIDGLHLEDGVLWTEVTRAMRDRWSVGPDGESGLVNFLSGVREAKMVVVFTERDNCTVDVGMRAAPGFDVAQVALKLGGGGHPQAAGCTLEGRLDQVRQRVVDELLRSLVGPHPEA
jgi:phosphoesterase RecJ-like protein